MKTKFKIDYKYNTHILILEMYVQYRYIIRNISLTLTLLMDVINNSEIPSINSVFNTIIGFHISMHKLVS